MVQKKVSKGYYNTCCLFAHTLCSGSPDLCFPLLFCWSPEHPILGSLVLWPLPTNTTYSHCSAHWLASSLLYVLSPPISSHAKEDFTVDIVWKT